MTRMHHCFGVFASRSSRGPTPLNGFGVIDTTDRCKGFLLSLMETTEHICPHVDETLKWTSANNWRAGATSAPKKTIQ